MENNKLKKEFVRFLKEKRLYSKVKRNIEEFAKEKCFNKTLNLFLNAGYNPIRVGFSWTRTPEGTNYWKNVAALWDHFMELL